MAAAPGDKGIDVRVEYVDTHNEHSDFGTYIGTDISMVEISDAGVLIFTHTTGMVAAVSPTGWTRVSKA